MSLSNSQKKNIKKNFRSKSISEIAQSLNVPEDEISEYILKKYPNISNKFLNKNIDIIKPKNFIFNFKSWVKDNFVLFIILGILVLLTYLNTFSNELVSDDKGLLINLPKWDLAFVFSKPYLFVRPLIYFILYSIADFNPFILRLPNILFHLCNVWLVFIILSFFGIKKVAFLTAVLFSIHPILIEPVAWISGGVYPQYSFFFLLGFLFYIFSVDKKKYYIYSLIFYIIALMSSEKAISLALVFFLYEFLFLNIKKNWKKLLPYFFLSLIWVFFQLSRFNERLEYFGGQQLIDSASYNPFLQVPIAISSYLQLLFWPDGLTLYHSEMSFSQAEFILRLGILVIFIILILFSFIKNKFIFFWLSFFIITLLPTLNPFVHAWVVAERYVYLGTIGIFASFSWVIGKFLNNKKTNALVLIFFTLIIFLLMVRSITRGGDWRNEDTLWLSAVRTSPSSDQNHNNLGDYYGRHGDLANAIKEFKTAIKLRPNYAEAYHNLGNAYRDLGNIDLALDSYNKSLSINPSIWQSYQNIAAIYYIQENYLLTKQYAEKGLEIDPQNTSLLSILGLSEFKLGNKNIAQEIFLKILTIDPNNQFANQALLQLKSGTLE